MAFNTDLAVRIAAAYDKAGFAKADKGINKLEKSAKQLGRTLGVALSTTAVVAFGKASVKAYAADQKAAAKLTNVIDNLGLSFANVEIASFIDKLALTSGVADDQLRPAFQALLTTTGSVIQSQKLLNTALDVSAGSGVDLATATLDIANAYVGNNKGLKKYTLGLTNAELKTASFDTVLGQFNRNFSGANAAYLDTYAGKMQLLTTSAAEAQEVIGKGLIDAFKILAGDSSISNLSDTMAKLANNIANFFRGLAIGFRDLAQMPVIKQLLQLAGLMLKLAGATAGFFIDPFVKAGARSQSSGIAPSSSNMHLQGLTATANAAAAAKAEAAAKKRAAELLKAQKGNTAELKKQALTKKQSALFDMEQISIIAALKGNISKEDKLRLELQLALITGNESEAAKLSKQLANSIDSTGKLSEYLRTLPDAKNPFKAWDAFLDAIIVKARQAAQISTGSSGNTFTPTDLTGVTTPAVIQAIMETDAATKAALEAAAAADTISAALPANNVSASGNTFNVYVEGSVISDDDLVTKIEAGLRKSALSGSPSQIGRLYGMFS